MSGEAPKVTKKPAGRPRAAVPKKATQSGPTGYSGKSGMAAAPAAVPVVLDPGGERVSVTASVDDLWS